MKKSITLALLIGCAFQTASAFETPEFLKNIGNLIANNKVAALTLTAGFLTIQACAYKNIDATIEVKEDNGSKKVEWETADVKQKWNAIWKSNIEIGAKHPFLYGTGIAGIIAAIIAAQKNVNVFSCFKK